jgi:hypothetical protein
MRLAEVPASRIDGRTLSRWIVSDRLEHDERSFEMKPKSTLLAAIAFSHLAFGGMDVNNHQSLGTVQAAVDYCAQVKPGDAAKYQEQAQLLTSGIAKDELAQLREADDYKAAYASVIASLGTVDAKEAALACDRFLTVDSGDKANE